VLSQGWAELTSPQKLDGVAVFQQSVPGRTVQEAAVGITSSTSKFTMPFDNTQGFVTAMALMNTNAAQSVGVTVVIRGANGAVLSTQSLLLGAREHIAFALPDRWSATGGRRGVAEFTTTGANITGLGLRFNAGGAFTSFPVFGQ
jgi:hypothetical protein